MSPNGIVVPVVLTIGRECGWVPVLDVRMRSRKRVTMARTAPVTLADAGPDTMPRSSPPVLLLAPRVDIGPAGFFYVFALLCWNRGDPGGRYRREEAFP
jgi:hypothetical protein